MSGFKAFLLRGNVIDLAVAVVIGSAFSAVVSAVVKDLLTPLLGIPGKADFSALTFSIRGSVFRYGEVANALVAFVSVATVIYFAVVRPMGHIQERRARGEAVEESTKSCPECLSEIPEAARRCAHCTSVVAG